MSGTIIIISVPFIYYLSSIALADKPHLGWTIPVNAGKHGDDVTYSLLLNITSLLIYTIDCDRAHRIDAFLATAILVKPIVFVRAGRMRNHMYDVRSARG